MSLSQELYDCYKKVCELRNTCNDKRPPNILSQEVIGLNDVYKTATLGINKASHYINDFSNEILKGRSSAFTIAVGKESAPLIVSLKQLADNVYKTDIDSENISTQETIQKDMSKAEDNLHVVEDLYKSANKFTQGLEYLIENIKNKNKLDKNLSTVSEISTFLDNNIVTSSPIAD